MVFDNLKIILVTDSIFLQETKDQANPKSVQCKSQSIKEMIFLRQFASTLIHCLTSFQR